MTEFAVGQRWLSENETELGLGIVESVDHRLVSVYFPATEDQRNYAKSNAPLSRVVYEIGEQIETLHGDIFTVGAVEELNSTKIYMVKDAQSDTLVPLPETQLSHYLKLDQASDRLFSGQVDSLKWFELRYAAMKAKEKQQRSNVLGLQGPRVDLIPHQLYIASEVGKRFAPRVLLSDEVGLGKTIEAGMIIHQQLLSHRVQRILIVVPQSLVHQWFVEMIRRFNLHFNIFDHSRVESLMQIDQELIDQMQEQEGTSIDPDMLQFENPFLSEQLVLCSTEFLAECDMTTLLDGEWDMLVVDEAHHLEWSPEKASTEYQRIEALSFKVPALLLLSATPEQLGQQSHFARLRLLDKNRFYDYDQFVEEQSKYQSIASLATKLEDAETLNASLQKDLEPYLGENVNVSPEQAIDLLVDFGGTGRVVFRNTRKNVKGFPQRIVHPHPVAACKEYQASLDHDTDSLTTIEKLRQLIHPETQFEQKNDNQDWCEFDSRVAWLKDFLKAHRNEKIVVICASKETAINLDLYCRFRLGINCCTFHEDLDLVSRDRAAAHFADLEDGAQAIFCSEIGSEGRNFQFSHHLVLMDLPLNPDLLEQRIGRLDRIGQTDDIQIHLPFFKGTSQAVLFDWYHLGMQAFEKTNAIGGQVAKSLNDLLVECLLNPDLSSLTKSLIDKTQSLAKSLVKELEGGKDKLLERSSFNREMAQQLAVDVKARDKLSPQAFMEHSWDRFGVEFDDHSEKTYVVHPGDHMFVQGFPSLPEEGLTATYDRQTALSRDDIHFLTWEHPMVSGAIDLVLSEKKGSASVCTIKNKGIKPGTLLVESLFKTECFAPEPLQAQRFLPFTCIRTLCDANGANIAGKVSHENLSKQCNKLDKRNSRLVLKSEEKKLRNILKSSESIANKAFDDLLKSSIDQMSSEQANEFNRLTTLKSRNPNVRDNEVDFVSRQTKLLEKHLKETTLQLEAIRVIVAI